jgi:hypothetical protein
MLDSVIIVGVVIIITTILSMSLSSLQTDKGTLYLKLIMLFATGALNIVNGAVFSGDVLTGAVITGYLKDGLVLGAAASGIYSMGENAISAKAEMVIAKFKRE